MFWLITSAFVLTFWWYKTEEKKLQSEWPHEIINEESDLQYATKEILPSAFSVFYLFINNNSIPRQELMLHKPSFNEIVEYLFKFQWNIKWCGRWIASSAVNIFSSFFVLSSAGSL